ncbi:amino acid ABC transporter permease [Mycobacteroides abscessus subsp. abscessus]|nr:amino acid ABC transporter permease [Mycobacteroides abscessus subsp. abscessus]
MSYSTTLWRIVIPQASRVAVPPLSNTLISLVKDTSLASAILVTDVMRTAQVAAAPTFQFFTLYVTAGVYYWIVCMAMSAVQDRLEQRLEKSVAR